MEKFIKHLEKQNYSKNTIYSYRYALTDFFKFLGGKTITLLNTSKYLKSQINKYKPATVRFKKHVILSYLRYSKCKFLDEIESIKIPSINNIFFNTINNEMFEVTIQMVENQEAKDLFKILYYTGVRISELKQLKYSKNKNSLIVFGKGMKYREIPILKPINNINFEKYNKYSKKQIYQLIKDYWPNWVTPHTFRRSFCTNLIRRGANIKIVSIIMGHSKIETTARYLHFTSSDIIKELENHFK